MGPAWYDKNLFGCATKEYPLRTIARKRKKKNEPAFVALYPVRGTRNQAKIDQVFGQEAIRRWSPPVATSPHPLERGERMITVWCRAVAPQV